MRKLGILLAILGVFGALWAMNMDVTVSGEFGTANNIGLMSDRQNYLIFSGIAVIAAILMIAFGGPKAPVVIGGPIDPFDEIEQTKQIDRKRYAISLGVRRVDGLYIYEGQKNLDLEEAIAAAELHQEITQPRPLSAEDAEAVAAEEWQAEHAKRQNRTSVLVVGIMVAVIVAFLIITVNHHPS